MKALIACEESQAVTIEFRKRSIEAYSCDILPCSGGHPEKHLLALPVRWLNNGVMLEGWTHPTLARHGGQWVIWSNKQKVFVQLDKAIPALLAACPGAVERLKINNEEPF